MALRKVTFNNASVRAADHGAIFAGILADGIINGCAISVSSGTASIAKGYFIAAGRLIENNASLTKNVSGGNVAQIVLAINLSDDTTTLDSMLEVRTAADVGSLTPLVQNDINDGVNTLYEFEIAVIDVNQNTIIRQMPMIARPIQILDAIPASWSGYKDGIYLVKQAAE